MHELDNDKKRESFTPNIANKYYSLQNIKNYIYNKKLKDFNKPNFIDTKIKKDYSNKIVIIRFNPKNI